MHARRALVVVSVLAALLLLGVYLLVGLELSRGANPLRYPSAVFDMDVTRIFQDWATSGVSSRTRVHPLYKLAIAPLVTALRGPSPAQALDALRILVAATMTLNVLLVGWLTVQLTGGARLPGLFTVLLCGASFSSVLFGSIPESASVSCLSSVAPLLYLNRRAGRPFSAGESVAWGLLGVLGLAFTITQLVPWLIALALRVRRARAAAADERPQLLRRLSVVLAVLVGVTALGVDVQARLYGVESFADRKLVREAFFLRIDDVQHEPLRHTARLASHFGLYNFTPPFPGYSDAQLLGLRKLGLPNYGAWGLSMEETSLASWHPAQALLAATLVGALLAAAYSLRRADGRFAAPLLVVGAQFGLHFFYGREYTLYSPNWHGVLVALLVASAWNSLGAWRRRLHWLVVPLAAAMLLNSVVVMDRVYDELRWGLHRTDRAADGRPLSADARR